MWILGFSRVNGKGGRASGSPRILVDASYRYSLNHDWLLRIISYFQQFLFMRIFKKDVHDKAWSGVREELTVCFIHLQKTILSNFTNLLRDK